MPISTLVRGLGIAAIFLLAGRREVGAQAVRRSLHIEPSVSLRRASERPLQHEGASVANGDTLLELTTHCRLRYASIFLALEASMVPEWFDPQQVGSSYLRGTPLSPALLFAPAGARKLSIGFERLF
jgi:hypothetical protein